LTPFIKLYTKSSLISENASLRFLDLKNRFVSSAYSMGVRYFKLRKRSLMYSRNRVGPNMEPSCTPQVIVLVLEKHSFILII